MNPFDGLTPDVSVFGAEFNLLWALLLSGIWGSAFVWYAVKLITSLMSVRDARQHSNVADYATAFSGVKTNLLGLLAVSSLPIIFAVMIFISNAV